MWCELQISHVLQSILERVNEPLLRRRSVYGFDVQIKASNFQAYFLVLPTDMFFSNFFLSFVHWFAQFLMVELELPCFRHNSITHKSSWKNLNVTFAHLQSYDFVFFLKNVLEFADEWPLN